VFLLLAIVMVVLEIITKKNPNKVATRAPQE